ncbi:MAG: hypothetical protein K8R46_07295 [Pirellulales bacterium]|nr:hypothetical protein [Pirellulales bacterium]
MDAILDWISGHDVVLGWLFAVSALMFIGSLIVVPWLVIRIPSDYFLDRRHFVDRWRPHHPWVRTALLASKNTFGGVLVLAGVAMLIFPGQGLLTIFVGLMFLDFPGKLALERWLINKPPVIRTINWMRRKAGRPPLELPKSTLTSGES